MQGEREMAYDANGHSSREGGNLWFPLSHAAVRVGLASAGAMARWWRERVDVRACGWPGGKLSRTGRRAGSSLGSDVGFGQCVVQYMHSGPLEAAGGPILTALHCNTG
jgi:hypothetical protein